jgi:hypothetical protein
MNIQRSSRYVKFFRYLENNNIDGVVKMLSLKNFNPAFELNVAVRYAAQNNKEEILKILIKDSRINPTVYHNQAFSNAASVGLINILKILLENDRIIASAYDNKAIRKAFFNQELKTVNFLFSIEDVRNSLSGDDIELYNHLIKLEVQQKINKF